MKEIVIATKNQGKIREIERVFGDLPVKVLSLASFGDLPDAVEDGRSFAENALKKARFYADLTQKSCLADDSGLEVDALGGAPGIYSARYAGARAGDAANNAKLLRELARAGGGERSARFRCCLALVDQDAVFECSGYCEGNILTAARGQGGFGYDPLFFIDRLGKSMAELSLEEKNQISHRGKALRAMAKELAGFLK